MGIAMDEAFRRLLSLMRHPSIKDKPITTIGELADHLEQVYRDRHFRSGPAAPRVEPERDRVFPRTRRT